jgi:hypothetical protein
MIDREKYDPIRIEKESELKVKVMKFHKNHWYFSFIINYSFFIQFIERDLYQTLVRSYLCNLQILWEFAFFKR